MALNVISNYAANVAHRYLQQSDEAATRSVAKLAAGTRVLGARDDAASLAISTSIRSDIGGLKQAAVNAGQASSMLQIADGAMGTVTDILVRLKTLAVQASSDQLNNDQRSQIGVEFGALQNEIDRIAQSTRFDGQNLMNGNGVGGGSSILAGAVSGGNASNKGAAYAFQVDQDAGGSDLGNVSDPNIVITAKVGGSEIRLSDVTANLDTVAEIAAAINADKLFSQYFVASSEKVNDSDKTARLYLNALTNDPLVSFNIQSDDGSGALSAITGLASTNIKVGQSVSFDLDGRELTQRDKINFSLGGVSSSLSLSDLVSWATHVSNVPSVSGTAQNKVAAVKQRVEFDLSGTLSKTSDKLTISVDGTSTSFSVASTGDSVAKTIDAFVAANATVGGATVTREGNKLVLTATSAGTAFTVDTVNAQTNGATAAEVSGVETQANLKEAAVGVDADGHFVRKNTTDVASANTSVKLTTAEVLKFVRDYVNDSTQPTHTLGTSMVASVSADGQLVLTAKGGTLGSQASFASGEVETAVGAGAFSVTFQIGSRNTAASRLTVDIANVSASSLGVDETSTKINTSANALNALNRIEAAITTIASSRSDIGAQQNRLDFAMANLASTIENQEAARSNLMDLDVAAEMSFFTGQQILQQAGVSMLAQANQMPQNLLRLFR